MFKYSLVCRRFWAVYYIKGICWEGWLLIFTKIFKWMITVALIGHWEMLLLMASDGRVHPWGCSLIHLSSSMLSRSIYMVEFSIYCRLVISAIPKITSPTLPFTFWSSFPTKFCRTDTSRAVILVGRIVLRKSNTTGRSLEPLGA